MVQFHSFDSNEHAFPSLGNTVSSTIGYLNGKYNLKLSCFLEGFPHPSGANARKNIQFKENKSRMLKLL